MGSQSQGSQPEAGPPVAEIPVGVTTQAESRKVKVESIPNYLFLVLYLCFSTKPGPLAQFPPPPEDGSVLWHEDSGWAKALHSHLPAMAYGPMVKWYDIAFALRKRQFDSA